MKITDWCKQIIEPGNSKIKFKTDNELIISIEGNGYSCARIIGRLGSFKKNSVCNISADFSIESDGSEYKFIPVLVQYDCDGNQLSGDYFEVNGKIHISLKISPETDYIETEFLLYSFGNARLTVSEPQITFQDTKKSRSVNVATGYFPRPYTSDPEDNMKAVERIIRSAAKDKIKPDIICFTETTYDRGLVNVEDVKWITRDSEPVRRVRNLAKECGMYIIFGIHELDNKRKYNTALLISDEGEIVGIYRKTHLTYGEVEVGINPGNELPIFELPFGKIGIMICWDQWFPGVASTLFKKGAEIVFVPTAGNPVPVYCSRAYENGGYIVVSGCQDNNPAASCIISQLGNVIAEVDDIEKGYAVATIELEEHKYIKWLSFKSGYGANLYPLDIRRDLIIKEEQI